MEHAASTIDEEDRAAIVDIVSRDGDLCDDGLLDELGQVFDDEIVYDVSDFGGAPLKGIAAAKQSALALGSRNPVGHHVSNIVITAIKSDTVHVRAKGSGIVSEPLRQVCRSEFR